MARVLAICIHNSARSQMTAAYIREFCDGCARVESAGLEPGTLNPHVVRAMSEDGIDISDNRTQSVSELYERGERFDYVIAVCDPEAAELCPVFPAEKIRLHWPFADPSALTGDEDTIMVGVRAIRDAIKSRVRQFCKEELYGCSGV